MKKQEESTALVRAGGRSLARGDDVIEAEIVEEPYERAFIRDISPCDTNMFPGGPRTVQDAKALGRQPCPNLLKCNNGYLDNRHCTMRWGGMIAAETLKCGSFEAELRELQEGHLRLSGGWITSDDRKVFRIVKDDIEGVRLVASFAARLLMGHSEASARMRESIGETFNDVVASATTSDGMIDTSRIEALEGRFGSNGGRGCDVRQGPCNCGAWH